MDMTDPKIQRGLAKEGARLREAEDAAAPPKKRRRPPRPTLSVATDNSAEQRARNEEFVREAAAEVNIHQVTSQANARNKAIVRYEQAVAALSRKVKTGREAVARRRMGSKVIQHGPRRYAEASDLSGAETDVMPDEPVSDLLDEGNLFKRQRAALPDDDDTSPPTDVASALRF